MPTFDLGKVVGDPGKDGKDGVSCTHSWNGTTLTVTSASGTSSANLKGADGSPGANGKDGKTPQKGTDYWTDSDKAEIVNDTVNAIANLSDIPDYWQEHLDSKCNTIKALQDAGGKDCFSFVVMTDLHYPSNLGKRSPALARYIMDQCGIKTVLVLGDVRHRGLWGTKELCETEWENIEAMFQPLSGRYLQTQGNHDAGYGSGDYDGDGDTDNYAYEFTPAEMFERVYRKAGLARNAVYDASGTAFYVDDVSNRVRYILLNTQLNFDGNAGYDSYETVDGMAKYPSMWKYRYTQCQYDFLTNDALASVPGDAWKVVIGSHIPINQTGEMPEYPVMIGVLKAYKNKTTYSGTYEGTASGGSTANFTNLHKPSDKNCLDNQYLYNDDGVTIVNSSTAVGKFVSAFIPAQCANKNADIIRAAGLDPTQDVHCYAYDASYNTLVGAHSTAYSDITFDDNGIMTWKAGYENNYISTSPANKLAYIRISGTKLSTIDDIVITVNEEITYTEGGGGGYDAVSVSCDFTNAKGDLIAYHGGHNHADTASKTGYPSTALSFPIITTRCDGKGENDETLKAERVAGTLTEQSFDVFTVNTKTRTIHATKIGAGADRTISY